MLLLIRTYIKSIKTLNKKILLTMIFFNKIKSNFSLFISSISICASFSSLWLYYNLFKKYELVKEALVEQTKIIAKLQNENLELLLRIKELTTSIANYETFWENVDLGASILTFLFLFVLVYNCPESVPSTKILPSVRKLPPVITPHRDGDVDIDFIDRTTNTYITLLKDEYQCELLFQPKGSWHISNLRELLAAHEEVLEHYRAADRVVDLATNVLQPTTLNHYRAADRVVDLATNVLQTATTPAVDAILSTIDKL